MEWPEVERRIEAGEDARTEFKRGMGDLRAIAHSKRSSTRPIPGKSASSRSPASAG